MDLKNEETYGRRTMYDRRNPYRIPSALGVPQSHKWADSEYDEKFVGKDVEVQRYKAADDHLKYDGLDFNTATETQNKYQPLDYGARQSKINPDNHFEYNGLEFGDGTEHSEFKEHNADRPVRYRGANNLQPLDGSMNEKTETRSVYSPKSGGRSDLVRQQSTLRPNGLDFDDGTENGRYLKDVPIERPARYRGAENLGRLDGRIESATETKEQYSEKNGKRSDMIRRNSQLQPNGLDFGEGTENGRYLRDLAVEKPLRYRGTENIHLLDGRLDSTTETSDQYNYKDGARRGSLYRRESVLKPNGLDFQDGTENSKYLRDMDVTKPERYRGAENIKVLDGKIDGETETSQKYRAERGRRAEMLKREGYMKYDGLDFEDGTENSKYLNGIPINKPEKYKGKSNLGPAEGELEGDTETSDKYKPKYGRRADKLRAQTAMRPTGLDFDETTENRKYLNGMPIDHPVRYKGTHNLGPLEGRLDDRTEYTKKYTESARKGSSRMKPNVKQILTTPYGDLAGEAIRLGDRKLYQHQVAV